MQPVRTEGEIVAQAFLETIAHYSKSLLVGAKFSVVVLEELLTRIEQDIANERGRADKRCCCRYSDAIECYIRRAPLYVSTKQAEHEARQIGGCQCACHSGQEEPT